MTKRVVYDERVSISIEEAILRAKAAAAGRYTYPSDEEALEDFLTTNWAWIEEVE